MFLYYIYFSLNCEIDWSCELMNCNFSIVSDGSCDLPEQIAAEQDINVVHFLVSFDGNDYKKEGVELSLSDLYQQMVDDLKTFPKTAAPSPEDFYVAFEKLAKQGKDILCICISSKLSSSLQSAQIAAQMLSDTYPDIRVTIMDSLCCTLMQAAYVLEACRMRDNGVTLEDAVNLLDDMRSTGRILFTVGSLDYLQHGGRIGKVTEIAGSLLNLKPLITLQDGEIHSSGIKRGRKASLKGIVELLVSYLQEQNCTPDDCRILIGYGYDAEEASILQEMTQKRLQELYGTEERFPVFRIGATIGVHAGPYSIGFGVMRRYDRI